MVVGFDWPPRLNASLACVVAGWVLASWLGRWVHNLVGHSRYIDATLKPLVASFARYVILALTVVAACRESIRRPRPATRTSHPGTRCR